MEDKQGNVNLKDDVLRSEHHSTLSAEEIAKAVQRHNREHKGDTQKKAAGQVTARGKKS
jgi:hypothetical protein